VLITPFPRGGGFSGMLPHCSAFLNKAERPHIGLLAGVPSHTVSSTFFRLHTDGRIGDEGRYMNDPSFPLLFKPKFRVTFSTAFEIVGGLK
jgi:hypothetical protein